MRFSVGNRCLMDPNLTWDLILDLIALRGTQLDHLECSKIDVGDVAGVTAWVYIVALDRQGEATFRFYREQERYLSKYSGSIVSDM